MDIEGRYIWCSDSASSTLYCINISDGSVVRTIPTPGAFAGGIAVVGNYIYHTDWGTDTLYIMDKVTGTIIDANALPSIIISTPIAMAHIGGDKFAILGGGAEPEPLVTVNHEGKVLSNISVGMRRGLAFDGYNIWGISITAAKVLKYSYSSPGDPIEYPDVGGIATQAMTYDGKYFYFADYSDNTIKIAY